LSSLQDEYGSGMVVVKATDIENGEIMDTLLVEITSVNDLPEFTQIPDTLKFRNDEDFTLQLDTSITDVEDLLDDFTIEAEADPADIGVSYDADNYIVTLSAPGFSGEGTLTITVTDSDGGEVSVSIVVVVELSTSNELAGDIPDHFDLLQNYPNPFNPATQIRFDLPEATEVKIEVFSMLGQKVATLANKRFTAGKHRVQFEAGALSSGMYIYRIQAGDFVKTKKMTLIK
ncbi:MAG: T9SS type A sorting domain-containing protein, partial [Balneolaceae bacterium]